MSLATQYPIEVLETTGSIRPIENVMRSHMFSIVGYSLDKDIGNGRFIESTIFEVGGHDWSIQYYPNGSDGAEDGDISLFLVLKSKSEVGKAQFSFTILDQSGCSLPFSETSDIKSFKTYSKNWGYPSFVKRAELESKIKNDCFIIECVVTVFKSFPVEPTAQFVVPPGNIDPAATSCN